MSLNAIIDKNVANDYKSSKSTYKVGKCGLQDDPSSICSKSVSTQHSIEHFVSIQVKPYEFRGKKAAALTMLRVTEKMRNKLDKLLKRERHTKQQQAESYKSTISHEMRTPIQSIIIFAK